MKFFDRIKLSGHICTIRLLASSPFQKQEWDERTLEWLIKHRDDFETEVKEEVKIILGLQFKVAQVDYFKGSVEVSVIIATAGVVYYAVSRYKNFIESLDILVFHLRKVLYRFVEPMDSRVSGEWLPCPNMVQFSGADLDVSLTRITMLLIWYLVLTNAVLLSLVIWILIRR